MTRSGEPRLGDRCQPKLAEVPPPALEAPIDVMGEVISVIEELRGIRAWLDTEEGRKLGSRARLNIILHVIDRKLKWAESFVSIRSRLLELVSVEVWLQELLVLLDDEVPEAKARLLERIRARIIWREIPAPAEAMEEGQPEG